MSKLPLVSIVTPCLNMAPFIRETIESVLSQDYPRIEYLVIDGGSTDGTLDILESYKDRLRYWSGPDDGAADAVNRGFARTSGEVFTFLHADDVFLPGAVSTAVRSLIANPSVAGVYGEGSWIDGEGRLAGRYPTREFDTRLLAQECIICQPSCFLRSAAFREAGMLDAGLHYAFDYDLWIRVARRGTLLKIDEELARSRMHAANKSLTGRRRMFGEVFAIQTKHFGYVPFQWTYGYSCYLLDGRDQFYQPLRHGIGKFFLSLPLGLACNRRHPLRYAAEWLRAVRRGLKLVALRSAPKA